MMGPALFELYAAPKKADLTAQISRSQDVPKTHEKITSQQSLPIMRKDSFKNSAVNFFRRDSDVPSIPQVTIGPSNRPIRAFRLMYVGSSGLDRRYTFPMLTWIVADIKKMSIEGESGTARNIYLEVSKEGLSATTVSDNRLMFVHPFQTLNKFTQLSNDTTCLTYLTRDHPESPFTCHVFQAPDEATVLEIFSLVQETCKDIVPQKGGNCRQLIKMGSANDLDSIMNNSQQYEVMYVGRLRVPQKQAAPTFIDEAVERFKDAESFKKKDIVNENETSEFRERCGSNSSTSSLPYTLEPVSMVPPENTLSLTRPRSISSLTVCDERTEDETDGGSLSKVPEEQTENETSTNSLRLPPPTLTNSVSLDDKSRETILKDLKSCSQSTMRATSAGRENQMASRQISLPASREMSTPRRRRYQNKPMLFLIGRLELRLISPDHQQILLNKSFNHVSHCSQGIEYPDHFGFICRDRDSTAVTSESYVGFIFRCQSAIVVKEILHSLRQAFLNAHSTSLNNSKPKIASFCEACPMHWFHRLCCDVEGLDAEKTWVFLMKAIQTGLNDDERDEVMTKYAEKKTHSTQEQNDLFMTILRKLCERNQLSHKHLGNVREPPQKSSSIDTFKAHVSNSFDQLLKTNSLKRNNKENRGKVRSMSDAQYLPLSSKLAKDILLSPSKSPSPGNLSDREVFSFDTESRVRSTTMGSPIDSRSPMTSTPIGSQKSLFSMFAKIGNNQGSKASSFDESEKQGKPTITSSIRRAIFHKVQASNLKHNNETELTQVTGRRRNREELRKLWKTAIKQQILLIQMDRENKKLRDTQSAVSNKRMKLDYEEVSPCPQESAAAWDRCLKDKSRWIEPVIDCLADKVKTGVPRLRRGEVWSLLVDRHHRNPESQCSKKKGQGCWSQESYRDLLNQLTPQQHAILVDLGRTFPKHPYYGQPLGPGQLSLFNLLKAYSLLDSEVGYCQGLSFVAGILLLHVNEDDAFQMMKHLLFHFGLRKQYKPDMSALQLQLYQLTRLIHDLEPKLFEHLELHDVSATLYAAPWFLTLFASQFPIGFVSRVFDVIFLLGIEAVFRVSLALLREHKELILTCNSFEAIMDLMRNELPNSSAPAMTRVLDDVFRVDLSKKLMIYEIEYQVVQEEMANCKQVIALTESRGTQVDPLPKMTENEVQTNATQQFSDGLQNQLVQLEADLKSSQHENMQLSDQLHVAQSHVHSLESQLDGFKSTMKHLESRVRSLEEERDALMQSNNMMRRRCEKLEAEKAASPSPDPPNEGEKDGGASKRSPVQDISVAIDVSRRSSNEEASVFDF